MPQVFVGDEEKTRRANLLNSITLIFLFCLCALIPIVLLDGGMTAGVIVIVIDLIGIAIVLLLRHLLRRGQVVFVGQAVIILMFVWISWIGIDQGVIRTPMAAAYLFVVLLTGLLFGWMSIVVSAAASSLAVLGLIRGEETEWLSKPDHMFALIHWLAYTGLFGIAGGLSFQAKQIMHKALVRAKEEIAERKRVEMELRKLSQAVEQSPVSIVITKLNGDIEYVNPRFTQVTGYSLAEAVGQNPRILKTEITPSETYRQLWCALTDGREWHGEFVNRKKDGSIYYESASILPVIGLDGEMTHYLAVKEDISERKRAEKLLRDSEERFRRMFEEHHAVMLVVEQDTGRILDANRSAQEFYGYSRSVMQTMCITDINTLTREQIWQERQRAAQNKLNYFIFPHRLANGDIRIVEVHASPLMLDGKAALFSIIHDITERKRTEESLRIHMEEVERLQAELRELSLHDPLTDLYNRRYLDEALGREVARANREHKALSIIIADIDRFKIVNDTYGHQLGDRFLMEMAKLMRMNSRGSDIVCRYGGEEFLLVIPGASTTDAFNRADEIRKRCAEFFIRHDGEILAITISLGVATYPCHGQDIEEVIAKADKALYRSKAAGRNRVTAWREADQESGPDQPVKNTSAAVCQDEPCECGDC